MSLLLRSNTLLRDGGGGGSPTLATTATTKTKTTHKEFDKLTLRCHPTAGSEIVIVIFSDVLINY